MTEISASLQQRHTQRRVDEDMYYLSNVAAYFSAREDDAIMNLYKRR
jgi:CHASE1-domain containing sensor protein